MIRKRELEPAQLKKDIGRRLRSAAVLSGAAANSRNGTFVPCIFPPLASNRDWTGLRSRIMKAAKRLGSCLESDGKVAVRGLRQLTHPKVRDEKGQGDRRDTLSGRGDGVCLADIIDIIR
jgi:hypothetical protein